MQLSIYKEIYDDLSLKGILFFARDSFLENFLPGIILRTGEVKAISQTIVSRYILLKFKN